MGDRRRDKEMALAAQGTEPVDRITGRPREGEEPGEHVHPTEDEMCYVLTGSLTFTCGSQTFGVETGGFVFLPRGVPHDYLIRSDGPVRLLVVTAPRENPVRVGMASWLVLRRAGTSFVNRTTHR